MSGPITRKRNMGQESDNTNEAKKQKNNSPNCPNCLRAMGRSSCIQCTACALWVHLKCSKLTYPEAKKEDVKKSFKCINCDPPPEDNVEEEEDMAVDLDVTSLVKLLIAQVKKLQTTVRSLATNNEMLLEKNQLMEKKIDKLLQNNRPVSPPNRNPTRTHSESQQRGRSMQRNMHAPSRSSSRSQSKSHRNLQFSAPAKPSKMTTTPNTDKRKQRRVLVVKNRNEKEPNSLPSVSVRLCTERVFVSGQDPDLRASDLHKHLSQSGVYPIAVKKLKTRYSHYSSFYVEVPDTDVDNMFVHEIWNEGAIIKIFNGRLRESDVIESYPSQ